MASFIVKKVKWVIFEEGEQCPSILDSNKRLQFSHAQVKIILSSVSLSFFVGAFDNRPKNHFLSWASAEIFPGGAQRRHFAYPLQVAIDAMQMDVHKTLYPFYTTKKIPHVTATVAKMRFVGSHSQVYYDDFQNRLCADFQNRVLHFTIALPSSL